MVKNLKVEHVTEEVSRALDRVNKEIVRSSTGSRSGRLWWRKKKTAEERREDHIVKGTVSMFSGVGLTIFLYYFTASLVLRLPPVWIDQVPFEIEPVVRILWLLGLVPMLSGAGHILAGLLIRPLPGADTSTAFANGSRSFEETSPRIESTPTSQPFAHESSSEHQGPASVTEHTTNLLK